jgi:hypothetical protein
MSAGMLAREKTYDTVFPEKYLFDLPPLTQ